MSTIPDDLRRFTDYLFSHDKEIFEVFAVNSGLALRPGDTGELQLIVLTAPHLYSEEQYKKLESHWNAFKATHGDTGF